MSRDLGAVVHGYPDLGNDGRTIRTLDVVRASEVTPRPVEWIWPRGVYCTGHLGAAERGGLRH
jgi:hypothetical protein